MLLRQIRSIDARLPVIVVTGRNETGLEEKVMAAGATAFLLKPVEDHELLGTVMNVTKRRK